MGDIKSVIVLVLMCLCIGSSNNEVSASREDKRDITSTAVDSEDVGNNVDPEKLDLGKKDDWNDTTVKGGPLSVDTTNLSVSEYYPWYGQGVVQECPEISDELCMDTHGYLRHWRKEVKAAIEEYVETLRRVFKATLRCSQGLAGPPAALFGQGWLQLYQGFIWTPSMDVNLVGKIFFDAPEQDVIRQGLEILQLSAMIEIPISQFMYSFFLTSAQNQQERLQGALTATAERLRAKVIFSLTKSAGNCQISLPRLKFSTERKKYKTNIQMVPSPYANAISPSLEVYLTKYVDDYLAESFFQPVLQGVLQVNVVQAIQKTPLNQQLTFEVCRKMFCVPKCQGGTRPPITINVTYINNPLPK